ncbi:MAG TPA: transcription termination factor NusA [Candidatus Kapabacteria bacterium]|nr:transcription termination factor NusA [Candidatus Kapabacteria bacterium]
MSSEISKAIQHICNEKGLNYETVLEAVESALAAAYRKDFGNRQQNIKAKFDPETGDMKAWDIKEVVEDIDPETLEKAQEELTLRREAARKEGRELSEEEMNDLVRFNPKTQLMLSEAKAIKKNATIGEVLEIPLEIPSDFGRMAAQTAKQVIIQKLREAERNTVFEDFKKQEGQIVQGIVQRRDRSGMIIVDLGKITGLVPVQEQIRREMYRPGSRMRFYIVSVSEGMRGPEIILSRSHKKMVEVVFEQEIPEIADGSVIIKAIARDAGNRSKVAVSTDDEGIDPIGSCIGQRGGRITTIIDELGGEKIDVIQYSDKTEDFIKHALSPAKVKSVDLKEAEKEATANVPADQFSLAIGRGGQNVRLAAELTGWKITVVQDGAEEVAVSSEDDETVVEGKLNETEPATETAEETTEEKKEE